jgi:hypothetical protein
MLENTEGAIKNGPPDKLTTYGPQDEENQNKNTTQYALDTYKQLEVNKNRTSF